MAQRRQFTADQLAMQEIARAEIMTITDAKYQDWARDTASRQCGDGRVVLDHIGNPDDPYDFDYRWYMLEDNQTGLDIYYHYNTDEGVSTVYVCQSDLARFPARQ